MNWRVGMIAVALFFSVAWSGSSQAADANKKYKIEGAGVLSCAQYLEARDKKSPMYYRLGGWMNGYMTAVNRYLPDTYALASWQSIDLLLASVAAKCKEDPTLSFHNVAQLLVGFLYASRLQENSPSLVAKRGEKKAIVYKSILMKAQQQLSDDGFYGGAINGEYDNETGEALLSYQGSKGLSETGLPDQRTLGTMFSKKTLPAK
ncbi:MAG: hypothetical protein HOM25_01850 [Rhodospirillaceae bacterium]|nr:hypothetical protein [Rhodospirillaceae bacterium]MBT5666210.1 hypothetical protein [Rhodospirillaceae bacterium]MBT5810152.1 hypothetical protein [Rhodospirillaceae bacterium]